MTMKKSLLVLAAVLATAGAAQADTLKKIKDTGKVVMGVRDSSAPLSYTLGAGKYAGYHVELCERIIADVAKQVKTLGRFPLPIEVVAFGHETTMQRICDALVECDIGIAPRLRVRDGQAVLTDGGNLIYDASCGAIPNPSLLASTLKSVTGVVDHGLFLDLADEALIGTDAGVQRVTP